MKNAKKIILGTSLFLALGASSASASVETLWAKGVTKERGWVDFNKSPSDQRDTSLCWAAAASNIIHWWQQQYELPEDVPQGDEIWETFKSSFTNEGGTPSKGFQWWLDGYYYAGNSSYAELTKDAAAAGYYRKYVGYYGGSDYTMNFGRTYPDISKYIIDALDDGYGLTLSLSYMHEVTLWGVEYDSDTNLITKMWITDSDDFKVGYTDSHLIEVECKGVEVYGEEFLGFSTEDFWYKNGPAEAYVLMGSALMPADFLTQIPEPSAFGLLAGLGALAVVASRRRRK